MADDKPINVTSHNQQGGITAGVVNIHAPQPQLQTKEVFAGRQVGNEFQTRIAVAIASFYAAQTLYVRATAPSITRLHLSPPANGRARETVDDKEPGMLYATVNRPGGQYLVDVVTTAAEPVQIECLLDAQHPTLPLAGDITGSMNFGF